MTAQLRIHRISIKNFRGISVFDQPIPEHGVIIRGANSRGKTSILRALQSALAAVDIGPDAVRLDEEKCEILVDLGHVSVQRVITAKGSSLRVKTLEGDTKGKPATYLQELLGSSPLDPIELITERDPKKRRAVVLAALPTRVTPEHLEKWLQGCDPKPSDEMLAHALTMHGLDAVAMLRKHFYDIRAAKNAELKGAHGRCEHLEAELRKHALPPSVESVRDAVTAHSAALQKVAALKGQGERAKIAEYRAETTRQEIAKLKALALDYEGQATSAAPSPNALPSAREALEAKTLAVKAAERAVEEAKALLRSAVAEQDAANARILDIERAQEKVRGLMNLSIEKHQSAQSLEEAITATAEPAPSLQDLADAETAERAAFERIALAELGEKAIQATEALKLARDTSRALEREAGLLTGVVDRLTHDAPKELIAESDGIPGLGVEGDSVTLDGVSIEKLSGAEAMKFCVDIARRANAKSKILIVDGLERLDDDQLRDFVKMATADAYQLLATKVASGDVQIEAISIDPA